MIIISFRIFFIAIAITMSAVVISTSLESNLFLEWSALASIPWMTATLKDFYALMIPFALWMIYKESSWPARMFWLVMFVCLGSIGTSIYMVRQLWMVQPNDPIEKLLVRGR